MSEFKAALESAISALESELPRIQNVLDAWESHGPATPVARDELDKLKDQYENGVVKKRLSDILEFCEVNDDDISRLESQEAGIQLHPLARVFEESYIDRLREYMNNIESRTSEGADSAYFGRPDAGHYIYACLTADWIPQLSDVRGEFHRALEAEGNYERSPEQLLHDMTEDTYEDAADTRLFCRLFDFKTELDGFNAYEVVPSDTEADPPQYIGGEFFMDEYARRKPDNFVWVAFDKLGALTDIYNNGVDHDDDYGLASDVSDLLDEGIELEEALKQKARPIMQQVIDETHEKYGAYRDSVIASVKNKQDEYDLSDDVVNAFADHVKRGIGTMIENVENEFSEEHQFNSDHNWGVFWQY